MIKETIGLVLAIVLLVAFVIGFASVVVAIWTTGGHMFAIAVKTGFTCLITCVFTGIILGLLVAGEK